MSAEILMLALIFSAAFISGRLAGRLGFPPVVGELIGGIVLGPPLIGILRPSDLATAIGHFGVLLLMLWVGLQIDTQEFRSVAKPALLVAFGGVLVPAALGFGAMVILGRPTTQAVFVALAMGVTALAIGPRILADLRILNTRVAHVIMMGAVITDVVVLIAFAALLDLGRATPSGFSWAAAGIAAGKAAVFALMAWTIAKPLLAYISRRFRETSLDQSTVFVATIIVGLVFAGLAELAGLHPIIGAFLAGLLLGSNHGTSSRLDYIRSTLRTVSFGTLAPVFFVTAGFQVSIGVIRTDLALLVAIIGIATVGKVAGSALFYLRTGNGWREGLVIGTGMNGRGAVEIIVAEIALRAGLIDQTLFSILVLMAIVTTATVPFIFSLGVGWLRGRGELVEVGQREGTIIIGAGSLARLLARILGPTGPITLIDLNPTNRDACLRDGLSAVLGDGLDERTIELAGINQAARVVAATANPEVNTLAAQLAANHGVPSVVALIPLEYSPPIKALLAEKGISILPIPGDPISWESALTLGDLDETTTIVVSRVGASAHILSSGHRSDAFLPLVVVGEAGRMPYDPAMMLQPGDRIVGVTKRRNGSQRFSGATEDRTDLPINEVQVSYEAL
jgi:Kef-type K+ transport system membrane component KefB